MSALTETNDSAPLAPVADAPDAVPDLRGLVRAYARYTLFRQPIPGESLPSLAFPLVTAGLVEEEDIYASRPGAGDRRPRPADISPEPEAGFRLRRGDPTGDRAAAVSGWRKHLANAVRPQLTYVQVEHWRVRECWERLEPTRKQLLKEVAIHASMDTAPEALEPPHAKTVARRNGMSVQSLRRHVAAGCDDIVQAIYRRLTTPVKLLPVPDDGASEHI